MKRVVSHLLIGLLVGCIASISIYAQTSQGCPTVEVTGPAGVTGPGESFHFSASVEGPALGPVGYRWTVSTGKIVEGQGTDKIKIDVDFAADAGRSLTATVEIVELRKECTATASESVNIGGCLTEPILEDEYSAPVGRVDEARLATFAIEMYMSPNSFGHVIEYFRSGTRTTAIDKKLAMTKAALVKAGLEADRFRIEVVTDADQNMTKLYRVPPGANNPVP